MRRVSVNVSKPLQNGTLCPISASGSNFNPRNILYIPVVEIIAFLELKHKLPLFKGFVSRPPNRRSTIGGLEIINYSLFSNSSISP